MRPAAHGSTPVKVSVLSPGILLARNLAEFSRQRP